MPVHELALGLNQTVEVELNLDPTGRPVVIYSNGYGTVALNDPIRERLAARLAPNGIGSCNYLYPERRVGRSTDDLLLSSGLCTLNTVAEWLRKVGAGPIVLFGSSFGALIALEHALLFKSDVAGLVLVSPPVDLAGYRQQQLGGVAMQSWQSNGSVYVDYGEGRRFRSSIRFLEEARNQDLHGRLLGAGLCPTLVLHGEDDPIITRDSLEPLRASSEDVKIVSILGMDHGFKRPSRFEEVLGVVVPFILHQVAHQLSDES